MAKIGRDYSSPESVIIFSHGAVMTELAEMFQVDRRTAQRQLLHLQPIGSRNGAPLYSVKEAASRLAPIPDDVVVRVLRMNHKDLPKDLSKEFWQALESKIRYLVRAEELWPTEQIIEYCGAAFNEIRMALLLIPDALGHEFTLTLEMRERTQQLVDGVLKDAARRLVTEFKKRRKTDGRGIDDIGPDGIETEEV